MGPKGCVWDKRSAASQTGSLPKAKPIAPPPSGLSTPTQPFTAGDPPSPVRHQANSHVAVTDSIAPRAAPKLLFF